jgi:hypothetical protein
MNSSSVEFFDNSKFVDSIVKKLCSRYTKSDFHPYPGIEFILDDRIRDRIFEDEDRDKGLGYIRHPENIKYFFNFDVVDKIPCLGDKSDSLFSVIFNEKVLLYKSDSEYQTIGDVLKKLIASGKRVTHIACAEEENGDDTDAIELFRNYDRIDVYEVK